MSDDVKKDILKAIQDAKNTGADSSKSSSVLIPAPNVLKHGLDQDGVVISAPVYRQDGKNK